MKLADIKYQDILLKCQPDDIEKIVYSGNDVLTEKCEVGIIFGGISMIPHRVNQAIELYENRQIERILVTGGIGFLNTDRKTPEGIKMENYLLENGVPKRDILVESNSRNSNENIMLSLDILRQEYNLDRTKIALITSDFHIKRCHEMIARHLNGENLFNSSVKDGITDIEHWQKSFYGKRLIYQEALLLCYYAKQAKISNLNIEGLSLERKLK